MLKPVELQVEYCCFRFNLDFLCVFQLIIFLCVLRVSAVKSFFSVFFRGFRGHSIGFCFEQR